MQVLLDKFGAALRAESAGAVLTTATHWEDLEIQEEAETGSSVTSKIRLPVQVRAPLPSPALPAAQADHHCDPGRSTLVSPAVVVVRAVAALPAVRGGEQGGCSRSATAHPAGAAPGLPHSGPAALPRPRAAASWHGKARTHVPVLVEQYLSSPLQRSWEYFPQQKFSLPFLDWQNKENLA